MQFTNNCHRLASGSDTATPVYTTLLEPGRRQEIRQSHNGEVMTPVYARQAGIIKGQGRDLNH